MRAPCRSSKAASSSALPSSPVRSRAMSKKSPYREDTGVPDTFAVATLCSWQPCDSSAGGQFPKRGIFFREPLRCDVPISDCRLRMTPRLRQLRADARACIACNVAAQIATRHRLPIERCRRWLLAKGGAVILLAVGRFRAIVSACGGGQRQRNHNAPCNEQ